MTVESIIFDTLKGLVSNRVYPDVAPLEAAMPFIVYQQVGGEAINFMDPTVPSKKNGRWQFAVWSESRATTAALARSVEDALRVAPGLQTTVIGGATAIYEEETKRRGSRQDFSFYF